DLLARVEPRLHDEQPQQHTAAARIVARLADGKGEPRRSALVALVRAAVASESAQDRDRCLRDLMSASHSFDAESAAAVAQAVLESMPEVRPPGEAEPLALVLHRAPKHP